MFSDSEKIKFNETEVVLTPNECNDVNCIYANHKKEQKGME